MGRHESTIQALKPRQKKLDKFLTHRIEKLNGSVALNHLFIEIWQRLAPSHCTHTKREIVFLTPQHKCLDYESLNWPVSVLQIFLLSKVLASLHPWYYHVDFESPC